MYIYIYIFSSYPTARDKHGWTVESSRAVTPEGGLAILLKLALIYGNWRLAKYDSPILYIL